MKYITKAGCNFEIDYDANLSRYTAEYRCKGSIGDPGFTHRISRMNISVKDSGEGEFTFVVSDILLPWIVLDPRDGAAKPAPAEENFVSKLLGLFKK